MPNTITQGTTPTLLDVEQVARMLNCSTRHVYRMADAGKMPRPVKLGALVRWPKDAIDKWIADGCTTVRNQSRSR